MSTSDIHFGILFLTFVFATWIFFVINSAFSQISTIWDVTSKPFFIPF